MSPNPTPLVTVIIPAFNLAGFLPEAVESALSQALPGGQRVDVVVVDDGSTDETPQIIAGFGSRVRGIRQTNRGLPSTRNRGASATSSEFLCFLDADDRLLPGKLSGEISLLKSNPHIDVAYSGWRYIDANGRPLPQRGWSREQGDVLPRLLLGNIIHPHAATVRRAAFVAVGGFDETLTSVEDWDLWLRISLAGSKWGLVDTLALEYRVREDGMHTNASRMLSNRLRVLDKTFDRLPSVRSELQTLRGAAYANAHLEAAADWMRAGHLSEAADAFRDALRAAPDLLVSSVALRAFSRLLLPLGSRNEGALVESWPTVGPQLHRLVQTATASERLPDRLAAFRTLSMLSFRYWRKGLRRLLGTT